MVDTIRLHETGVDILDQRLLPTRVSYITTDDYLVVADAIRTLAVRGAPAIGVAAACGLVLAARAAGDEPLLAMETAADLLRSTRPTAVNLFWAIDRMLAVARTTTGDVPAALEQAARSIHDQDVAANRAMGRYGAGLVTAPSRFLTHCNAGALATGGYGTALGVIRAAHSQGNVLTVYADETRPLLQGSRLTAWELTRDGIDVVVITDNMAGHVMSRGLVDLIVVGADRIAANGDVANKIGTYSLAVLARAHEIPMYVAAPTSTIDLSLSDGSLIPIEERDSSEVRRLGGVQVVPDAAGVYNPAFDVTPAELISAIITECGVIRPPFASGLAGAVQSGVNRGQV